MRNLIVFVFIIIWYSPNSIGFSQNSSLQQTEKEKVFDSIVSLFQSNKKDDALEATIRYIRNRTSTFERVQLYFHPPLLEVFADKKIDSIVFGEILNQYCYDYCNWNTNDTEVFLRFYIQDQKYRQFKTWYANDNQYAMADSMRVLYTSNDLLNQRWASEFIDNRSMDDIYCCGPFCVYTLFIIIQHSPYNLQRMYFPLFEWFCISDMLNPYSLALLEDRLLVKEGKTQKYGTQFFCRSNKKNCYPQPHMPIDSMNYFRRQIGIGDVIEEWNTTWGFQCDTNDVFE